MRKCKCGEVMVVVDVRPMGGLVTRQEIQVDYYCQKCHNEEKSNKG